MREMSKEEWKKLMELRIPSPAQRTVLAKIVGTDLIQNTGEGDFGLTIWDPLTNNAGSFQLLEVIIKDKDCRLFYDDGINEYFIYGPDDDAPLTHRAVLRDAIVEAAMNLWFPEEENNV